MRRLPDMDILKIDPSRKQDRREFLNLPFRIYKDTPQWVPMMESDARLMLDTKKHPYYQHSQAAFFLAHDDGRTIGRLAVLDNHWGNQHNHASEGFFYLFECENNLEAARGLFEAGCRWAREQGLTVLTGPHGFTQLDGGGMLVKGFEHRASFGMLYNLPYYPDLVEACGFVHIADSVSGYLDANIQYPERIMELSKRIQQRRGLHIARFESRKDIKKFIPKLKDLYNGAMIGMEGGIPLTDGEVDAIANQLLWFVDPKLVKIVMKGDQPVGFLLAYADISKALQKTKGRFFPFGWLIMLLELRRSDFLNINGAGMLEEYRGSGGTAILFTEMFKTIKEGGRFKAAEAVQIGTENDRMQREMKNFGIDFYKTHRTYKKELE
jgi:hypothetical protein